MWRRRDEIYSDYMNNARQTIRRRKNVRSFTYNGPHYTQYLMAQMSKIHQYYNESIKLEL